MLPSNPLVLAVGQNPQPFTPVRGTDIVSSQHCPPNTVPERGQVTDDLPEVGASIPGKQSWNVLSEHVSGSNLAYNVAEGGPHVSLVCVSALLAGAGEGLAGKAACNHVRNASVLGCPASGDELSDIPEDGSHIDAAVRLAGLEDLLTVGLPLDVADAAVSEQAVGEHAASSTGEEVKDIHTPSTGQEEAIGPCGFSS